MKRFIYYLLGFIILIGIICLFFIKLNNGDDDKKDLEKVRVAEVAHTIFYAPQYAAISQGFFEEEGLDIELILTPGADNLATESVT